MVRGTQKQIIHLKNPENPLFEEAFLIVKQPLRQDVPALTMVEEANRLIATHATVANQTQTPSTTRILRVVLLYISGILTGMLATLLFFV